MKQDFYRALEERFRASREEIRTRLEVYRPLLAALQALFPEPRAMDLGCGRGEWLELLVEQGFTASGVDLDDGMLAACRELGLPVENRDALEALKNLPASSLELVSAFHVVEHVSSDYLLELLTEIHRVLVDGGVLILETPNSENILVGTSSFYLDPTHRHPVPAPLLEFMAHYCGFSDGMVLRLQENKNLRDRASHIGLWQVFYGVSPDYALVSRKPPADPMQPDPLAALSDLKASGLRLETLANRHDQILADWRALIDVNAQRLDIQVRSWFDELSASLKDLQAYSGALSERIDRLQAQAEQAEAELRAVYASRSWRITVPLRRLTGFARRLNALTVGDRMPRSVQTTDQSCQEHHQEKALKKKPDLNV